MEWSLASSNFTTWSVIPSRLMAATADNRWAECRCKHFRICQKYHQHPQRISTQLYHQQIHQRQWLTSEMEQLFYSKIETGSQRSLSLHIIQYWQHQKECVSARNLTQGSVHILYGRLVKAGRSDHGHICVRLQTHPHRPHSQTCLQMDAGHSRDAFAHVSVNARRHICIHTSLLRIWWFPTQPGERWQGRGEQLAVTSAYRTSSGSMQQLKLDLCTPSSDKQKLQLDTSECC